MYGLETAHLRKPERERLDAFQRRGIRNILQVKHTCINRRNKNEKIYEWANAAIKEVRDDGKKIILLSDYFKERRTILRLRILNQECDSLITNITINLETLKQPTRNLRKPHRPRDEWTNKAIEDYWENIQAG